MKKLLAMWVGISLLAPALWAETYTIDPAHSSVGFKIKHLVGKVAGKFDKFTGTFSYDPAKPQAMTVDATIESTSVDTGIQKRDDHLRSPDFFNVQKFPTITFKSTQVTVVSGSAYKLAGNLTIKGVTKAVTLDMDIAGVAKDPMGAGTRAGAAATGKINRNDFTVGPSSGPMTGMLGTDVEIQIDVEGTSKK